ncbi:hypothetical protein EDD37DRAFT_648521 [Exophiala viscosa]|uniref:uncharacterized protein n=1 Tax=Exophiala viscosa TaxID=2486360 RepID=UPI002195FA9C|nr:hypothetical protein EDD37DRAFT_648521 [Exophiala viscosa]
MARPFQPRAVGFTTNTTPYIHPRQDDGSGSHSRGFWVGVAFFLVITLSLVLRSSYLADTYRFRRWRACLGLHPANQPPIIHGPSPDWRFTTIKRPEAAYIGWSSSDTLPLYEPTSNFSTEVLAALMRFGVQPGKRSPSYRSRLTWDLEAAVGEGLVEQNRKRTLQPSPEQIEIDRQKSGAKNRAITESSS